MQNGPDFDNLIAPFIKIYQNIEHDLLIKVASHFKLYEDIGFKNSMEWYIKKIEELGGLNQEAVEIISKYSKIPKSKIIDMLKEAGLSTLDIDTIEKLNKVRSYKIDVNKLMISETFNDIVNNSYKEVNEIFKLINTKAIEGTKEAYMSVLNQAYTEVSSGIFDYNTSVSKAINKMVDNGITIAQYKQKDGSIRRYGIDSCIRRDVLTAVVQCTNKASDNFINELEAEYVEVSQHLGARVTDANDYTNHSWWQGKVYKLVGYTSEYPNFQETCNEGDIQGIGGVNCRHLKWAFFPGISAPKAIHISEEENQKLYEQQQTQKKYERKIRLYKNKIDSFKEIKDYDKVEQYKEKLKNINTEYDEYCDINNLKRNYTRERNYFSNNTKNKDYEVYKKSLIVGKFDISKYTDEIQTTTKDVILTDERRKHIIDRHPDVEKYISNIGEIIKTPDRVFKQLDKEDTIWLMKTIDSDKIRITLKLNTINNLKEKGYKNSIIQMQNMKHSNIDNLIKNGKIEELNKK